jgi:hypothetical protein
MINDVVDQILGRAGRMQVAGARTGLAHTLGGPGAVSCVAVLGQPLSARPRRSRRASLTPRSVAERILSPAGARLC